MREREIEGGRERARESERERESERARERERECITLMMDKHTVIIIYAKILS